GAGFRNGNTSGQALIRHLKAEDLALVLQIGSQDLLVDAIIGRGLDLPDGIERQGQLFGNRKPPAIALDGVHQIAGLVINLKDRPLQERPSGQAVGGIVVRGPLDNLNLASDGRILPLHQGGLTRLDIDRAQLGVRDVPLILQLAQVKTTASLQVLKPGIAPVIGGLLVDGVMTAVIENERYAGDTFPVRGGDFVYQDAGDGLVFDDLLGDLAILDGEIVPGGIQFESGGAFLLQGIIIALGKRSKHSARVSGGNGVYQGVIRCLVDLKNGVRKPLRLVRGV
ncbi:HNH endonuclease, partial [Dysosmobacter welbionis]